MPEFFDSTASFPMKTRQSLYARGGRVEAKKGRWIQEATASIKRRGTKCQTYRKTSLYRL